MGLHHANVEVRGSKGFLQGAGSLLAARHSKHLPRAANLREVHQQHLNPKILSSLFNVVILFLAIQFSTCYYFLKLDFDSDMFSTLV